jgi:hypothetical protein
MSFDSVFDQLAEAIGDRDLLKNLSDLGVIAGGSVAHCLNGMGSIKDLDVFLPKSEDIDYIEKIREIFANKEVTYSSYYRQGVLNAHLNSSTRPIQFIFSHLSTLKEICENFDLDYVVCGIHKGELYYPRDTKYIHENKFIERYPDPSNLSVVGRLKKSVDKGYQSYWFGHFNGREPDFYATNLDSFLHVEFGNDGYLVHARRRMVDMELIGIYQKHNLYITTAGQWSTKKNKNGIVVCEFLVKMRNEGTNTIEKVRLSTICMKMTISHTTNVNPNTKRVHVDLSDDARYLFDNLYIDQRPLDESSFGQSKNYEVRCYMTMDRQLNAFVVQELDDGWVPFPCNINGIKYPNVQNLINFSIGFPEGRNFGLCEETAEEKLEEITEEEENDADEIIRLIRRDEDCKHVLSALACVLTYAQVFYIVWMLRWDHIKR